jgi:hypothetical protein
MSAAERLALRGVLVERRTALLNRLAADTAEMIKPGFLRLLADLHTTIAAIDDELAEFVTAGDAP